MLEVLIDSLLDGLKIFPFLLIIYILMEILENHLGEKKAEKLLRGKYAPIFGSLVGIIPECGFSAMYARLYDNGLITMGTVLAIFISTSDEGLIVLLGSGNITYLMYTIGIKIVYGAIVGLAFNFLLRKRDILASEENTDKCVECGEEHKNNWDKYLFHPLLHSLKILFYICVVNIVFGSLIYFIGENNINAFLSTNAAFQPIIAALIGLIPNCSASIILAQGFTVGAINFAGLIAGLTANAGIGLALIFKNKKRFKNNMIILGLLYASAVIIGYITLIFI